MGAMVGACVLCAFSLMFLMPLMHQFFSRYFMLLMPMMAIVTVYVLAEILCRLKVEPKMSYALLLALVVLNSLTADFGESSAYRFQNTLATEDYVQRVKGRDVVIAVSSLSFLYGQSGVLMNAKKVLVLEDTDCFSDVQEVVENAHGGLFLNENYYAGKCMDCVPRRALLVCPQMAQNLHFVSVVRYNEIYFDLYEIK